jgi:aminoglycoside/choline kinase family phosphotransferase
LIWEFQHYLEWGIEQLSDVTVAQADSEIVDRAFERLADEILSAGFCLAHRDYNATNVKLRPSGETVIIDFQDAALASPAYDVASLMFDANTSRFVGPTLRGEAIAAWVEATASLAGPKSSARLIDIQGLQRCLKAAGRFVWLARVRGKTSFLNLLPETLALACDVMSRHPDLADLAGTLGRYEPRLRSKPR